MSPVIPRKTASSLSVLFLSCRAGGATGSTGEPPISDAVGDWGTKVSIGCPSGCVVCCRRGIACAIPVPPGATADFLRRFSGMLVLAFECYPAQWVMGTAMHCQPSCARRDPLHQECESISDDHSRAPSGGSKRSRPKCVFRHPSSRHEHTTFLGLGQFGHSQFYAVLGRRLGRLLSSLECVPNERRVPAVGTALCRRVRTGPDTATERCGYSPWLSAWFQQTRLPGCAPACWLASLYSWLAGP